MRTRESDTRSAAATGSIGLALVLRPKNVNLDAIGQILIDQHGDVLAVLQGLRKL